MVSPLVFQICTPIICIVLFLSTLGHSISIDGIPPTLTVGQEVTVTWDLATEGSEAAILTKSWELVYLRETDGVVVDGFGLLPLNTEPQHGTFTTTVPTDLPDVVGTGQILARVLTFDGNFISDFATPIPSIAVVDPETSITDSLQIEGSPPTLTVGQEVTVTWDIPTRGHEATLLTKTWELVYLRETDGVVVDGFGLLPLNTELQHGTFTTTVPTDLPDVVGTGQILARVLTFDGNFLTDFATPIPSIEVVDPTASATRVIVTPPVMGTSSFP